MKMLIVCASMALSVGLGAPTFAEGPTPADVVAFQAALHQSDAHIMSHQGDLTAFSDGMAHTMDVAIHVAERDYPQLGRAWEACRAQMYSLDGGVTYQVVPQYRAYCDAVMSRIAPIASQDFKLLMAAIGSPVE